MKIKFNYLGPFLFGPHSGSVVSIKVQGFGLDPDGCEILPFFFSFLFFSLLLHQFSCESENQTAVRIGSNVVSVVYVMFSSTSYPN